MAFRLEYFHLSHLKVKVKVKVKVMHNSNVNVSQTVTDRTNNTIANTDSRNWQIYVSPWPILLGNVRVIHISTANMSKIVTYRSNITIVIQYEVAYRHSISIFMFDLGSF